MKSLFDPQTQREVLERLDSLTDSSIPLWGRMKVGQMVHHCQMPLEVALGNPQRLKVPNPLVRLLMKGYKKNLYNDRPWKRNMPTAPGFKVTEDKDFIREKSKLIQLLNDFHLLREKGELEPHPIFGTFTKQQWGQMQYKHLDHHLRQFGV